MAMKFWNTTKLYTLEIEERVNPEGTRHVPVWLSTIPSSASAERAVRKDGCGVENSTSSPSRTAVQSWQRRRRPSYVTHNAKYCLAMTVETQIEGPGCCLMMSIEYLGFCREAALRGRSQPPWCPQHAERRI
jgi:hypothetical protein